MAMSVRIARCVEAHLKLNELCLQIAQMAGIARVENPQAAPMENCEPLARYILRVMAESLVEGDIWIAAFGGEKIRRGCQETEPKRAKHRVFHVRRSRLHWSGSLRIR
jgi:hypothetical protein